MNKNIKLLIIILILLLAAGGAAAFLLHDRNAAQDDEIIYDEESDDDGLDDEEIIDMEEFDNGIEYDEELEGADIAFSDSASEEDFYGTWSADSGHSAFLYGELELTIEEGGKWHGIVVDEEEEGIWTFDGKTMLLTSEFFEAMLTFSEDGKLIMQEDREGNGNSEEFLNTVLTKK